MKKNKKIDLIIVIGLLFLGACLHYFYNLKPLIGGCIYILPSVFFLCAREKKNYKKLFWALLLFGGLAGFFFDFVQYFNGGWFISRLAIPWKLFGFWPIDDWLGYFLMTAIIIVFYEHFLDDEKNKHISKNLLSCLILLLLAAILTIVFYLYSPEKIKMTYVYLKGGFAAVFFPIIFLFKKPKLLPKFLMVSAFFFFVWFLAEIVTLKTGGWVFPGQYLGQVLIFGISFPFEELFFWMLFYSGTITMFYEFFIDDRK